MAEQMDEGQEFVAPTMSLGEEFVESDGEFLGLVITDRWEPGKFSPQLHIAVKRVDYTIGGKTGAFSTWYPLSKRPRSKLGYFRMALIKNLSLGAEPKLGVGIFHLVPTRPRSNPLLPKGF